MFSKKSSEKDKKYTSFRPTELPVDDSRCVMLDEALEMDDVINIGVIGPYSSGKSSVIKSTLKKRYIRKFNSRVLNLSLADFKYSKVNTDLSSQLEYELVNKIFYGSRIDFVDKIPGSKIKRIRDFKISTFIKRYIFGIALFILTWFLFSRDTTYIDNLSNIIGLELTWILIVVFVVMIGVVIYVIIYKLYYNFNLTELVFKFKNLEVKKSTNGSSTINEYIDEICYFIKKSKYEVVVLEDIDRFKDVGIFIKLRELADALNKNCKRSIKFIYAVGDDVLDSSSGDKTKFFDFIVQIKPHITYKQSFKTLKNKVTAIIEDVFPDGEYQNLYDNRDYNDLLREFSLTVNNYRIIIAMCNDFKLSLLEIKRDNEQFTGIEIIKVLAFSMYRVVYSDDQSLLYNSEGVLYKLLCSRNELDKFVTSSLRSRLSELQQELDSLNKHHYFAIEMLLEYKIIKAVERQFRTNIAYFNFTYKPSNIEHDQLSYFLSKIDFKKLHDDKFSGIITNYGEIIFTNDDILQLTNQFRSGEYKTELAKNIMELQAEISCSDALGYRELYYTYTDIVTKFMRDRANASDIHPNKTSKNENRYDFLIYLVINEFIESHDYHNYNINSFGGMTYNDIEFVNYVRGGTLRNFEQNITELYNLKLTDLTEICDCLNAKHFYNNYRVLNIDYIDYIFSEDIGELMTAIIDTILNKNYFYEPIGVTFWNEYISASTWMPLLDFVTNDDGTFFLNLVKSNFLSPVSLIKLLLNYEDKIMAYEFNDENRGAISKYFSMNIDLTNLNHLKFREIAKHFNVEFQLDYDNLEKLNSELIWFILDNDLYKINILSLSALHDFMFVEYEKSLFEDLISIGQIYKRFTSNKALFLEHVIIHDESYTSASIEEVELYLMLNIDINLKKRLVNKFNQLDYTNIVKTISNVALRYYIIENCKTDLDIFEMIEYYNVENEDNIVLLLNDKGARNPKSIKIQFKEKLHKILCNKNLTKDKFENIVQGLIALNFKLEESILRQVPEEQALLVILEYIKIDNESLYEFIMIELISEYFDWFKDSNKAALMNALVNNNELYNKYTNIILDLKDKVKKPELLDPRFKGKRRRKN